MNPVQKKTFKQARSAHVALQKRRDALANLRLGKTVTIHLAGKQMVRVEPLNGRNPHGKFVLYLLNKTLTYAYCAEKGSRYLVGSRVLGLEDIFGVVLTVKYPDGKVINREF